MAAGTGSAFRRCPACGVRLIPWCCLRRSKANDSRRERGGRRPHDRERSHVRVGLPGRGVRGRHDRPVRQDVLAYGKDDCVLWETPLGYAIRGVAAQYLSTQAASDDAGLPPGVREEHSVWVRTLDGLVWNLDATTGKILATTTAPCPVYGLTLERKGQPWMTHGTCLGRVDTTRCKDDTCDGTATRGSTPPSARRARREWPSTGTCRLPLPQARPDRVSGEAIAGAVELALRSGGPSPIVPPCSSP